MPIMEGSDDVEWVDITDEMKSLNAYQELRKEWGKKRTAGRRKIARETEKEEKKKDKKGKKDKKDKGKKKKK